jgi:hypothetical protein
MGRQKCKQNYYQVAEVRGTTEGLRILAQMIAHQIMAREKRQDGHGTAMNQKSLMPDAVARSRDKNGGTK